METTTAHTIPMKETKATADVLASGKSCVVMGIGNSMTPILKSGQCVVVDPITETTVISKNDIVFCKARGHYYIHLVHGVRNNGQYLIGNNHGKFNGWITKNNIFGKVSKILP